EDVRVVFRSQLFPALLAWRHTLGATEDERARWYRNLIRLFENRLRAAGGYPPEAAPHTMGNSTIYFWQFLPDLMVRFRVVETPPRPRRWSELRRKLARRRRTIIEVTITAWDHYPSRV